VERPLIKESLPHPLTGFRVGMTSFSYLAHISSKYNDIGSSSGLIWGLRFLLLGFGEGSKISTPLESVSLSSVLLFVLFLYNGHPFLLFKSEDNKIAANFGLKFFYIGLKSKKICGVIFHITVDMYMIAFFDIHV
jgi:hypothetical protein